MTLELNKEKRVVFKATHIVRKLNYGSPFRHIHEFVKTNLNSCGINYSKSNLHSIICNRFEALKQDYYISIVNLTTY